MEIVNSQCENFLILLPLLAVQGPQNFNISLLEVRNFDFRENSIFGSGTNSKNL